METILSAFITGALALLGVVVTNMMSNKSIENKLMMAQAVTDEKIDNLRKAVEKHSSAVERVPVLETRVESIEKKVDNLENRVNDLEKYKT